MKRPKAARTSGPNDRIGPRSRHLRQVLANRLPCLAASEPRPLTRGRQAGRAAGSPDFAAVPRRMRSNACSCVAWDFLRVDPTVGTRPEEGGDGVARRAGETLPSDRVLHQTVWRGRKTGSIRVSKKGQSLTAFDAHLAGHRSALIGQNARDITAGLPSVGMRNLNFA